MPLDTPPNHNDLEVTLIGPNVGESVLIHFRGDWFLIDSCSDKASGQPAALVYLQRFNVAPAQVKVVACSHWHDDHFKGISELYRTFPDAQLWMSHALGRREFVEVVESWRGWPPGAAPHTSGLEELTACIDLALQRGTAPNFAGPNQRMWSADDQSAELWSLTPSPEMIVKSLADIAKLVPTVWSEKNAAADTKPNNTSVAMHFKAGEHSILLGSDLEESGNPLTGWSAVIGSAARPRAKATLYKVSHHGSETGHHNGIWTDLLAPSPVSIMTPFTRSHLPRDSDVERIKARSSRAFISARRAMTDVKRNGAVAKLTSSNNLTVVDGQAGLIRCRVDCLNGAAVWGVELFTPAEAL